MSLKDYVRSGSGAADITPLLAKGAVFKELIVRVCQLFEKELIDLVVCVEGRGFILGSAVAYEFGCGIIPLRYPGKLKNETYTETFIDYSGKTKELQIHKDAISEGQKVLIVDDWLETGATIKAAIHLVEKCGGKIAGIGVFMDDSSIETKEFLARYNYQYLEQVKPGDSF